MRADIHDGQEHKRSVQGPDTEAQDLSPPNHHFPLATRGRSIEKCHIRTFAPTMFSRCLGGDIRINEPGKRAEPVLKIPSAFRSPLAQTPDRHQQHASLTSRDTRIASAWAISQMRAAICTAEPKRSSPSSTGSPAWIPILTRIGVSLISLYDASSS